ncbi:SusD/RagB family nutrient-binding outer membrane lipoprotein [Pontibacter ramchanderi]|uniref:SusD-like starch-binding protein associating with outer membrane n=1 Tax=Pontibacter ramchanderi TaxID=1179743 RepID=A0A2N3V3S2_9BACT|nr:SusD/RagB family nutrient-binding outer membrane lipoprotein [Pontibacter ramchanderi]PKV76261.1 SusD-like starch-binding protein associating with outer membrane [Pontibacter ramchanderi]
MKKIYAVLLSCFMLASCDKFDEDININPNEPSAATATQLIANAQLSLSSLSATPAAQFHAQYLSETQYPGASLYPDGGTSFYWIYQGPLMNLETVLTTAKLSTTEGPINNQLAVAKILRAYYYWHVTDRWGDVPYSEALQGVENFTPKYDTQESIYNSLFAMLEQANNEITAGNISNDIIYNGDVNKWKRLGNTIRMLMALRLSEVDPTKGAAEFNKALQAGIMTSNADNLVFRHLADANNQNYWYGQVSNQNREWWALTETLVNKLKPVNDPRLQVYGAPARTSGEYRGLPYGTVQGLPNVTNYSLLGQAIWKQDAHIQLVTYAQALFAKAEAAKRGWIPGGDAEAEANYNKAIEQSLLQWTGSAAGASTLLSQEGVTYNADNAIEQIATQRWIHLFMHGYEAWAEWRRTGYPANLVEPDGGRAVPRRNSYPANEAFNNTTSYNEAVQRQFGGQDNLYGRVWWDK